MGDDGARSNPRAKVEFARLAELHGRLVAKASMNPRQPRPAPPKASTVLGTVTRVVGQAGRPNASV